MYQLKITNHFFSNKMHRIPAPFKRLQVIRNDYKQILNLKNNTGFSNNKEEQVRQKVFRWLNEKIGIHQDYITIEEHVGEAKGRADLVVRDKNNNVIWIFECKHEGIPLSTDILKQVERYDDFLISKYISITNGLEIETYCFNEKTKQSEPVATPLNLKELKGKFRKIAPKPHPLRYLKWNEIYEQNPIRKHAKQLDTTDMQELPILWKKAVLNLYRALNVTQRNVWEGKIEGTHIEIIRDYGIQSIRMGNASGWNDASLMRSLQIKYKKENYRVGLQLMPWFKQGGTKLSFIVNLATYKAYERDSHNALQLNTEKCFTIDDNGYLHCRHNRAPSIGNRGSANNVLFFEYLKKSNISWLYTDEKGKYWIELGSFKNNKWLSWKSLDLQKIIGRIIEYAIIRDKFRELQKEKNTLNEQK